jgi:hypothetical protein
MMLKGSAARGGVARGSSRARSVVVRAERPLWAPGVVAPAWLDGSLPGDRGKRTVSGGAGLPKQPIGPYIAEIHATAGVWFPERPGGLRVCVLAPHASNGPAPTRRLRSHGPGRGPQGAGLVRGVGGLGGVGLRGRTLPRARAAAKTWAAVLALLWVMEKGGAHVRPGVHLHARAAGAQRRAPPA